MTGYGITADNRTHAFLYDEVGCGVCPFWLRSLAFGINNINHVVGTVDDRAFWYAGGDLVDLNTFIESRADLLLTAAIAINDHHQTLAKRCDQAGVFCYDTVLLDSVYALP